MYGISSSDFEIYRQVYLMIIIAKDLSYLFKQRTGFQSPYKPVLIFHIFDVFAHYLSDVSSVLPLSIRTKLYSVSLNLTCDLPVSRSCLRTRVFSFRGSSSFSNALRTES